jgi:hypothetical protein
MVYLRRRIRLKRLGIKKVPSPYGTIFISRNDTCFPVPEASTTAVRSVGVPRKVIQYLSGKSIHEANVPI